MTPPPFELVTVESEFVVIDKAPDVDFHRNAGDQSLVERVRDALGMASLYPVHRLDRMTSGLLLFGRTAAAAAALTEAFRERRIEKYYVALSDRPPSKKQGWIIGDMTRSRRGSWKLLPSRQHPAVTRFVSRSAAPGLRAFLLRPYTGRTHQLRVALKSLSAPILGDPLYHPAYPIPTDRGYLHAYALRFQLGETLHTLARAPSQGEAFRTSDFERVLSEWGAPWELAWPLPPLSIQPTRQQEEEEE